MSAVLDAYPSARAGARPYLQRHCRNRQRPVRELLRATRPAHRQHAAVNRVYAAKLAGARLPEGRAATALRAARGRAPRSPPLEAEASRVQEQSDSFNSVGIVGADGVILAASRNFRGFLGARVDSPAAGPRSRRADQPALCDRRQSADHAVAPIYSRDGRYRGYIAGSIHLRNESALQNCWAATITRMAPIWPWWTGTAS